MNIWHSGYKGRVELALLVTRREMIRKGNSLDRNHSELFYLFYSTWSYKRWFVSIYILFDWFKRKKFISVTIFKEILTIYNIRTSYIDSYNNVFVTIGVAQKSSRWTPSVLVIYLISRVKRWSCILILELRHFQKIETWIFLNFVSISYLCYVSLIFLPSYGDLAIVTQTSYGLTKAQYLSPYPTFIKLSAVIIARLRALFIFIILQCRF